MSTDPHDQLLLQIRGAVAEYERTLIAERMRRGLWPSCGGRAAAMDSAAVRVPAGPGATARSGRGAGRAQRGGAGRADVRLLPRAAGNPVSARQAADRSGGGHPDGQAAVERRQRARHLAQPGLRLPGADQSHPGHPGPAGANPRCCRSARAKATRHARRRSGSKSRCRRSSPRKPSPRCRPSWIPTSRPRRATPGMSTCCAPWSAAEPAGWVPRPAKPGRLPVLPVPRPHARAASGPGTAVHGPGRHPGRTAGRAGLG